MQKIAVVGATGLVGRELLKLLEKWLSPVSLRLFASAKSANEKLLFKNQEQQIEEFGINKLDGGIAFFCAGKTVSLQSLPKKSIVAIDLSSAFRQKENIPLIVPEINGHLYPNNLKNWFWAISKLLKFVYRKWLNINNIEPLAIGKLQCFEAAENPILQVVSV